MSVFVVEQAVVARLHERLEREVRVDAVRTVADEQAMVMHFARFAGLEHDADSGALRAVARGGDARRRTRAARSRARGPVRRPGPTARACCNRRRSRARPRRKCGRSRAVSPPGARLRSNVMSIVSDRQPRWFRFLMPASSSFVRIGWRRRKPLCVLRRALEQIALGADVALERHDDFFADRVDRRVSHLREQLPEIVVEHPRLVG